MTKREETILRANILGGMNDYILEVIGDEEIMDYWWSEGLPDCCDEDFLMELAEDENQFEDLVKTFYYCLRASREE